MRYWQKTTGGASYALRYTLITGILLISTPAFYYLSFSLISRVHYHKARNFFQKEYYGLAADRLEKADAYQPDNCMISKELGKVYKKLGTLAPAADRAYFLTQKSKSFYQKAALLNPLDYETAYRMAVAEAKMEQLYSYLHPEEKDNPHQPLSIFKQAALLRPNGISLHYAMARYLFRQGKTDELLAVIRKLTHIYPPSYHYLKKEAFWNSDVREACRRGLEEAIKAEISLRNAHMAISSLLALDKKWTASISHYQEALRFKTFQNKAANYFHLGRLHMKNGRMDAGEKSFFHALEISRSKEKDLEGLYHFYKKEGDPEKLYQFYRKVSRHFILFSHMDILMAMSLIDLNRYDQARQILKDLNRETPTAGAYYQLACIAEIEKDWDKMELAIQKATVHEPENSHYHLVFSGVLKRLKKLERAEKEAGLALKHSAKPSPWLFNHRAWIRWNRKDYLGAARDWQRAIRLRSDHAPFYAQAAEAYRKLGHRPLILGYYQKAMNLDPDNEHYRKRYIELKAESP